MSALIWLIPIALLLGAVGLCAFMWSARHGQFEDLDGAAERIFLDEGDRPLDDPAAADSGDVEERTNPVRSRRASPRQRGGR